MKNQTNLEFFQQPFWRRRAEDLPVDDETSSCWVGLSVVVLCRGLQSQTRICPSGGDELKICQSVSRRPAVGSVRRSSSSAGVYGARPAGALNPSQQRARTLQNSESPARTT
nr:uncharacterized protein LOC107389230 isoform X3 [Nothobranchius furzeri]